MADHRIDSPIWALYLFRQMPLQEVRKENGKLRIPGIFLNVV